MKSLRTAQGHSFLLILVIFCNNGLEVQLQLDTCWCRMLEDLDLRISREKRKTMLTTRGNSSGRGVIRLKGQPIAGGWKFQVFGK